MRFLILLVVVGLLCASPSNYNVYKLPNGKTPVIDGNLDEWAECYFIDSLHSDDNVFARDDTLPWTRGDFQMALYAAWDDQKVYFAVKILADDTIISSGGHMCRMDNLKFNPGGLAMAKCIGIDGSIDISSSSPYTWGSTLFASVNPNGNGDLPTYEFAIQKYLLDPDSSDNFKMSIGSEENDNTQYTNSMFLAIGVEYVGDKQDWNGNPWDNPIYYPTFNLIDSVRCKGPAEYTVYKLPPGQKPIIDGSIGEWMEAYFIDSIHSDDNVYARDALEPWTREEFQMELYMAHDDSMIYCAAKVTSDDVIFSVDYSPTRSDNVKINLGGETMAPWLAINGDLRWPWTSHIIPGVTFIYGADSTGNGTLPTYEWAVYKDLLSPFELNTYRFSFGSEDNDKPNQTDVCFLAVGACYTGDKQDWNSNPWDNPDYFPTFIFVDTVPVPPSIEYNHVQRTNNIYIGSNTPNPFKPTTVIPYNTGLHKSGIVRFFNPNGRIVHSTKISGKGNIVWNAASMPSGVYILQAKIGPFKQTRQLILIR